MEYGDMSINGTNPNETVEGMHSIVFDIMKELTRLEDENMIITECHVQLKFIEGPGIQEYEQIQDGTTSIIIDKTSLEKAKEYINNRKVYRPLISILSEYSDRESLGWMSKEKFNEFANKFTKAYIDIFGLLCPDDDVDEPYDFFDINGILRNNNLPYEIRKLRSGDTPYIIDRIE